MHYAPRSELLPEWDVQEDMEKLNERLISYSRRHLLLNNELEDLQQEHNREYKLFPRNELVDSAFVY